MKWNNPKTKFCQRRVAFHFPNLQNMFNVGRHREDSSLVGFRKLPIPVILFRLIAASIPKPEDESFANRSLQRFVALMVWHIRMNVCSAIKFCEYMLTCLLSTVCLTCSHLGQFCLAKRPKYLPLVFAKWNKWSLKKEFIYFCFTTFTLAPLTIAPNYTPPSKATKKYINQLLKFLRLLCLI